MNEDFGWMINSPCHINITDSGCKILKFINQYLLIKEKIILEQVIWIVHQLVLFSDKRGCCKI